MEGSKARRLTGICWLVFIPTEKKDEERRQARPAHAPAHVGDTGSEFIYRLVRETAKDETSRAAWSPMPEFSGRYWCHFFGGVWVSRHRSP